MADRNAALFFFTSEEEYNSSSGKLGSVPFNYQDLYATESIVEGSTEYIANSPRDASYEEILHMTQDYGITHMLPLFQEEITEATKKAVANSWYSPPSELPKADYDQEYFATIWDVYLDAWRYAAPPAQFGEYKFNTRASLLQNDPIGHAIVEAFLPKHLTYNARIDKNYDGIFHLNLDPTLSYTFKSQYLIDATLTGTKSSGLKGNDKANSLTGNTGNNTLIGGKGNDQLDGKDGLDTAFFTGAHSEYTINTNGVTTTITDNIANRDGSNTLTNIEKVTFTDQTITL
jgi:Ca2+-binding RTX toxin-like protein